MKRRRKLRDDPRLQSPLASEPRLGRERVHAARATGQSKTSDSTGTPLHIPFTLYDTEKYGESWVYGFWAMGIRPADSFYFAFGFGAYAGFWSAYWAARRLGATVIPGGADTEGHVKNILSQKPTVLIATPSYALRIAEQVREMGHDLSESSIEFTYHAGEPGPAP